MNTGSLRIRFSWNDPVTGERREPLLTPPIAFGRDMAQMPQSLQGRPVPRMLINDSQVGRYHALIDVEADGVVVIDQNSTNGTWVNGVRQTRTVLHSGDILRIGATEISLTFALPQLPINSQQPSSNSPQPVTVNPQQPPINPQQPATVNPQQSPLIFRQVRLRWDEPLTGETKEDIFLPPIAFGRDGSQMPSTVDPDNRIVLNSEQVSRYHALIDWQNDQLMAIDRGSTNHIFINGTEQKQSVLANGDTIQIGPYQITISFGSSGATALLIPPKTSTILFNANNGQLAPQPATPSVSAASFPPNQFLQAQQVAIQDLHATRCAVDERDYVAIGAGLGSFVWVDLLRLSGVRKEQIAALGLQPEPYARYKQLCMNSQIPSHERLRSNSDSCPDNIWGWPSYALREAWHDFRMGKIDKAFRYLWQVFTEPDLIETYTPRSGNVFDSIDREAKRIGWNQIYRYGSVRNIRQTNDGRYAIAYSAGEGNFGFLVSKYVQIAIGYPGIRFLPDLKAYRDQTKDFKSVVNAYEFHDHVYQHLSQHGGVVILRGRGIVASRIIQRVYEIRATGKNITIIHLMRSPLSKGHTFNHAQRLVKYHQEFQPFNWPKACWGGDLRVMLEKASPENRLKLLTDWGGTTTADRQDWQVMVNQGFNEGWYKIEFGEVERVEKNQPFGTITYIKPNFKGEVKLQADFIIDATGLEANIEESSLYKDLKTTYNLPIYKNGRITVADDFEIPGMRNQKGKIYAAGAMTLGGPYAAVDSFLGLQYAAMISVDSLAASHAPGVHYLNLFSSFIQWIKWAKNQAP